MQFHCFTLNVIPSYMLAKITFVCFPSAVSHCKPLFNLLFTTSPKSSFFFLVLSKHYLPSIVYLCFRLFPLSIWLFSFHYWMLFCLVFQIFSPALVSSLALPILFLYCHLNKASQVNKVAFPSSPFFLIYLSVRKGKMQKGYNGKRGKRLQMELTPMPTVFHGYL